MTKLVLFIHGLGGEADSTWEKFPELIRADGELSKLYDVATAGYDTGIFRSQPSLAACAGILKTEIDNRYPNMPISRSSATVRAGLSRAPTSPNGSTAARNSG
jgi:hypothetical protein